MNKKQYTFQREQKYLVLKWEDINKALAMNYQKKQLQKILSVIEVMRASQGKKDNSYVVINEDEPYAEQVWSLIKAQEEQNHAAGYVKVEPAEHNRECKCPNCDRDVSLLLYESGSEIKGVTGERLYECCNCLKTWRVSELPLVLEPAEGELAPNPHPKGYGSDDFIDGFKEGSVAQLAYDKATMGKQLSELQGVCGRLMQDNTELTEKVATMVRLPSEEEFIKILQGYIVGKDKANIRDFMLPEEIVLLAQELLKLLRKEP